LLQLIDSAVAAAAAVAVAVVADRFAFYLLSLPFTYSSNAPNRAKMLFISTGAGSSCGLTSNGNTCLLPF
jgi:hypothetical protein